MKGDRVTWIKIYDENFERKDDRAKSSAENMVKRPGDSLIKKVF